MKNKKILAIDYGEKKVGVAVSGELQMFSAQLDTIFVKNSKHRLQKIQELVIALCPEKIVVGVPYTYNKQVNFQSKKILNFVEDLKSSLEKLKDLNKISCIPDIILYDESFTTLQAEKGKTKKFKQKKSDSEAARLLLQEYLNSINNEYKNEKD